MLVKCILSVALFLVGQNLFGQSYDVTEKKLKNIFKSSISQNSKTKVQTNSNPWTICNKDSSYFKSDTILLYPANTTQYRLHSQCCNFIDWTFYKKNAFVLTREQICKEPSTISATKSEDWFIIKLSTRNQNLFLETFNQGKLTERFRVITIDPIITLVRTAL